MSTHKDFNTEYDSHPELAMVLSLAEGSKGLSQFLKRLFEDGFQLTPLIGTKAGKAKWPKLARGR